MDHDEADEGYEIAGSGRSESEPVHQHKTRRPHRKSRYGCTKCKVRRIKCDEGTPRCSRCEKMNLTCQYRKKKDTDYWTEPPDFSWLEQTLPPAEFELLKHYLEHTSKHSTVGEHDKYTLQIGIPNLACQCKPLMRSVLALAATCKCSDIISQTSTPPEASDRSQVIELLSLAQRYHSESLHEIQATLQEAKNYDHVLANAAMMGMYGSASHAARIWLAKTAPFGEDPQLFDLTMPGNPQWMSLFRAVRVAYAGLLRNSPQPSPASTPPALTIQYEYKAPSRAPPDLEPRTFTITSHPLGPILAATVGSALARLDEKAAEIYALTQPTTTTPDQTTTALQACFSALSILRTIITTSLLPAPPSSPTASTPNPSTPSPTPNHHHQYPHQHPHHFQHAFPLDLQHVDDAAAERLAEISPWLRKYTASITSTIPSHLPRRTIMSFVHKVPTAYLGLIEEMIGLMQMQEVGVGMGEVPSVAHQLAVEIFAHWLVLVMLLDNVWWIGGIGAWELERFVGVRRCEGWEGCLWNRDRDWWPESMLEIGRQFDKYR
ncbi:hypothetical protein F5144DRAFT_487021 [Chaetomium tenue]|uniref:Uncharacterized protein n=1 Tax=Chaetomium tenue TaxID=1854479 RepID=A0ACB7PFS3_9PEZI|nr:hypothetical protein F5144DRAFT_487021 [Chaetomium globosum]